jgi:hypothetical protein
MGIGLRTLVTAGLLLAGSAHAEVTDKSAEGFEVVEKVTIDAPKAKVYAAMMTPGAWWSGKHTFSGDAKNLSIDMATGCFCEKLPHGFARHLTVIYADGGSGLRLSGGLGPMQFTGAAGVLGFALKDNGAKTDLVLTYDVGGYAKGGLADRLAAPVDMVLGEQASRLKMFVETGKPQ